MKIGIDKVIGLGKHAPSPKEASYEQVTSRPWLVAEILCTWKWPGGSAVASFLPSLSSYAKSRSYGFQESLLDSVFNILLDGALVHGGRSARSFSHLWPASGDEVKDIEEPFLRALVSFLYTLFKDDIWETQKVKTLFEFLVNKLFIGEAININCLRILPPLVNVLVRALCQNSIGSGESSTDARLDSPKENHLQDALEGWLQRTLLFPPLVSWKIEEGNSNLFFFFFLINNSKSSLWCFSRLLIDMNHVQRQIMMPTQEFKHNSARTFIVSLIAFNYFFFFFLFCACVWGGRGRGWAWGRLTIEKEIF